jgi:hypothetical protein
LANRKQLGQISNVLAEMPDGKHSGDPAFPGQSGFCISFSRICLDQPQVIPDEPGKGNTMTDDQTPTTGPVAATAEKDKALRAEAEARTGLAQANDNLLNVAARALLRQLQPSQGALNDQEVEPLWELAAATDERLRLRFVEAALDDPVLRRRLKDRAPFALQAAVGLDPTRRTRVEELLGQRLQAREALP